ncbi:hypothetical protein AVEN_90353-1, partial [Araneus ventricosus]
MGTCRESATRFFPAWKTNLRPPFVNKAPEEGISACLELSAFS